MQVTLLFLKVVFTFSFQCDVKTQRVCVGCILYLCISLPVLWNWCFMKLLRKNITHVYRYFRVRCMNISLYLVSIEFTNTCLNVHMPHSRPSCAQWINAFLFIHCVCIFLCCRMWRMCKQQHRNPSDEWWWRLHSCCGRCECVVWAHHATSNLPFLGQWAIYFAIWYSPTMRNNEYTIGSVCLEQLRVWDQKYKSWINMQATH